MAAPQGGIFYGSRPHDTDPGPLYEMLTSTGRNHQDFEEATTTSPRLGWRSRSRPTSERTLRDILIG